MKRYMLSITFLLLLYLCGCSNEKTNQHTTSPTTDVPSVQSYDLNELRAFFVPHHMDRALYTGELGDATSDEFAEKLLTYNEVNHHFPVEYLKTASSVCRYIMYPVDQGGFYYVFLCYFQPEESGERTPETLDYMYVLFSAYLSDRNSVDEYPYVDYYQVKPGTTTMSDVIKLDPNVECVFLSGGTYTCSLLDNSTVLQVRYTFEQGNSDSDRSFLESLIARNVSVEKIEDSVSVLAQISGQGARGERGRGDGGVSSQENGIDPN